MKNKNKPRRQKYKRPKVTKQILKTKQTKNTKSSKRHFNMWVYKYFDMTNVQDNEKK